MSVIGKSWLNDVRNKREIAPLSFMNDFPLIFVLASPSLAL